MRCKNNRGGWFEAMMGAKGFQREKEGFRVHLLSQLSYRKTGDRGLADRSTWDRKTGRKHRQAHDEGAVLLLTLTSHKALKDFFFLRCLNSQKSFKHATLVSVFKRQCVIKKLLLLLINKHGFK